jgi:hypothetical protein
MYGLKPVPFKKDEFSATPLAVPHQSGLIAGWNRQIQA